MPIVGKDAVILTAGETILVNAMNNSAANSGGIGALHFDGPHLQSVLHVYLSHGGHYLSAAGRLMTVDDVSGLSPKRT